MINPNSCNHSGTYFAALICNPFLTHQELVTGRRESRVKRSLGPDQRREVSDFDSCVDEDASLLGYEIVSALSKFRKGMQCPFIGPKQSKERAAMLQTLWRLATDWKFTGPNPNGKDFL